MAKRLYQYSDALANMFLEKHSSTQRQLTNDDEDVHAGSPSTDISQAVL